MSDDIPEEDKEYHLLFVQLLNKIPMTHYDLLGQLLKSHSNLIRMREKQKIENQTPQGSYRVGHLLK